MSFDGSRWIKNGVAAKMEVLTYTGRYIVLFQVFQVENGNGNNYGRILKW
jgi:hypothetical protein